MIDHVDLSGLFLFAHGAPSELNALLGASGFSSYRPFIRILVSGSFDLAGLKHLPAHFALYDFLSGFSACSFLLYLPLVLRLVFQSRDLSRHAYLITHGASSDFESGSRAGRFPFHDPIFRHCMPVRCDLAFFRPLAALRAEGIFQSRFPACGLTVDYPFARVGVGMRSHTNRCSYRVRHDDLSRKRRLEYQDRPQYGYEGGFGQSPDELDVLSFGFEGFAPGTFSELGYRFLIEFIRVEEILFPGSRAFSRIIELAHLPSSFSS